MVFEKNLHRRHDTQVELHMIQNFYQKYSKVIFWATLLSFPFLLIQARSLPTNNDVETWLPGESDVRTTYNDFKRDFGAEEIILIALPSEISEPKLVESLCSRLERIDGVQSCWSPERFKKAMQQLDVSTDESDRRLRGFLISQNDRFRGLVATLDEDGLKRRHVIVDEVKQQLNYCQLNSRSVALAGTPVVIAELDRLGGAENNERFFLLTLLISLCLLYYSIRQWRLSLSILFLTVWAINLTQAIIKVAGGESNFIMGALSVMIMVFTLANCIHFLHYFCSCREEEHPLEVALKKAWKPCGLATLTTTIGLISLTISDILPVKQFGYSAAIGSVIALIAGLGLTPVALTVWPIRKKYLEEQDSFTANALVCLRHSKLVAGLSFLLVVVTGIGLFRINSKIDPLDFLPKHNKVLSDVESIEHDLTKLNSIEAVVDFGESDMPFVDRLKEVSRLQNLIDSHPDVYYTLSAATFFPRNLPESPFAAARLLNKAQTMNGESGGGFLAEGDRLWRISARVSATSGLSRQKVFEDLQEMLANEPVTLTGIAPLLEGAQKAIFEGFWESFATAFLIITVIMILALRSLKIGFIAMVPNVTPLCIVFGSLGWLGIPVDIGMMMTGSIALGIAVDGTFHFLVHYDNAYRKTGDSAAAAKASLLQTGSPIFKAAMIGSIGMLALTLSSFAPTTRFGYMMTTLLLAALVGDLVLLPAILSLRPGNKQTVVVEDDSPSLMDKHEEADSILELDEESATIAAPYLFGQVESTIHSKAG